MGIECCALGEVCVLHEIGGEGDEGGEGGFVVEVRAAFGVFVGCRAGDELEAEELVGVGEVVGGKENRGFVSWSVICQSMLPLTVSKTYSAANIFFAVSASYTGFGVGFLPGAIAPKPILLSVPASDHPSGRSS